MTVKRLATWLCVGAACLLPAALTRAEDTIVLPRAKANDATQNLGRDRGGAAILDAGYRGAGFRGGYRGGFGYRGYVGYRGGYWGGYGGYRSFAFGYYPRVYTPFVSLGVYTAAPYYVAPPAYYAPTYYYSSPSVYVTPSYYPIADSTPSSGSVFRLRVDTPPTGAPLPAGPAPATGGNPAGEALPAPRPDRTFPYDGGPQAPVPMPPPDPASNARPPAGSPDEGKVVKLPGLSPRAYPAYGVKPDYGVVNEERTIVRRNPVNPPSK